MVRVYAGGKQVELTGLYDRMKSLTKDNPACTGTSCRPAASR